MRWIVVVCLGMGLALARAGEPAPSLRVDRQYSDHMVLQRDEELRLRGHAAPGVRISGRFDKLTAKAKADADGAWTLQWPAREAGGPFEIEVKAGKQALTLRDVLIGDVWLASGQSNMEFMLRDAADGAATIAGAEDPAIREFKVPHDFSIEPKPEPADGQWRVASKDQVGEFSAVAYYFARKLRAGEAVPIGIINSTWGGSRIEAWSDARVLGLGAAELRARFEREEARHRDAEQRVAALNAKAPDEATERHWATSDFDDSAWPLLRVPGAWESQGYDDMNGTAWYRASFELTAAQAKGAARVVLGTIDDSDATFINGQTVGAMSQAWTTPRDYAIAEGVLRAGRNVIAVRVEDTGGAGGFREAPQGLFVTGADGTRVSLPAQWRFMPARVRADAARHYNLEPAGLNHAMIQPWLATPIRGVIWYQGEADANDADASRYAERFSRLITGWRDAFARPELPFLWVQLANYRSGSDRYDGERLLHSPWAEVRAAQGATLQLPYTAQVLALDVGDSGDIHPRDKRTIGERLAAAALRVAYAQGEVDATARASHVNREGAQLRVSFTPFSATVRGRGGHAPGALEIAGGDGVFHPARVRFEDGDLLLDAAGVSEPREARYAWRDDPVGANLVNEFGEPVAPFWLRVPTP